MMSKQQLELERTAHVEAAIPGEQPTVSPAAREGETERIVRWKRASLLKRRWHMIGWAGGALTLLLILGLVLETSLFTKGNQTPQHTPLPVVQVHPPAHSTYDAHPPAPLFGQTVNVTLTVREVLISIAPGIAYHAWTFNGTVPGPVIHVHQGQTVHFTLINAGNMPHSIDFHAAQTPWNINYQEVPPGKSFSFDWKANYPGVFLYHCGAPTVIYHMANGMYGTVLVDPATGWVPAQEYVLVQSEFYTTKAPDGSYFADSQKLATGNPDYVVFNGYANQYKADPLIAKVGQRIRLFIVNAGPTLFSAFHVIGAIFSDTYVDGNPANHLVGNQTVTIPPGGGMVVELTIPQAGIYPFVTHSFADVDKGALGVIQVTP
jgi:nitrite reductase (NO-forming)